MVKWDGAELVQSNTTVRDVCECYLCEVESGRILGRRRLIKPSTLRMDRGRLEIHVLPLLGERKVASLKLRDIEGAEADIVAGKTSKPRVGGRGGTTKGVKGVTSRTMSTLHAVVEHAVRLGEIESNPARCVRRIATTTRERRLGRSEIDRLGKAMRTAEKDGEHPTGLAAIRFLLMTGFRRMEALRLQRAWLDSDESYVRFPDTMSGPQNRVVGRSALNLLLAQPIVERSLFFFQADWGDGPFTGVVRVLERVCANTRIDDITPHTLRHTFASVAADLGFSELTIAALLGHAAGGVTQRYVDIDEALRLAADQVSAEIEALLAGKAAIERRVSAAIGTAGD